ncbi:hyalin-like [Saccoglossus kowalevskii]
MHHMNILAAMDRRRLVFMIGIFLLYFANYCAVFGEDTTDHHITCPDDVVEPTATGDNGAVIEWFAPQVWNDSGSVTVNCDRLSGSKFYIGKTTVTCTATNPSDNTVECNFSVDIVDEENPTLVNCPSNIQQNTDNGESYATVIWQEPTPGDNSGSPNMISNRSPGQLFSIGDTEVTYTVTDPTGRQAPPCLFTITVTDAEEPVISFCPNTKHQDSDTGLMTAIVDWTEPTAADNSGVFTHDEDPTLSNCPSNIHRNTDVGKPYATVTWQEPTPEDNSGFPTMTSTRSPGDQFYMGVNEVTYTVTDPAGNVVSPCSFTITVIDSENPIITLCPSDINQGTDPGTDVAEVRWDLPVAEDNSGIVSVVGNYQPGDVFDIGTTTVNYEASDESGHTDTCSFQIVVFGKCVYSYG